MTDLKGRACLVTGGSRGIGRAIALELGRCGASVAVGFVSNEDAAEQVAAEIASFGGTAFAFGCDVQDAAAIETAVANVIDASGRSTHSSTTPGSPATGRWPRCPRRSGTPSSRRT